ncbi:MAG: hypothetical protein L3K26_17450, partial [Candidatus Hydrogenedentes bacterium]|nr:hypothetical protein [Candidatus Hydrogenedentota bacterium]
MAPTHEMLRGVLPSHVKTVLAGDSPDGAPGKEWDISVHRLSDSDVPPRADALYLDSSGCTAEALSARLRPLRLKVRREGAIFCADDCNTLSFGEHLNTLAELGLGLYQAWRILPDVGALVKLEQSPEPGAGPYLFRYQRERYDPVAHARSFLRELNYYSAIDVLRTVPDHWFASDEERGLHAAEYLMALLAQNRYSGGKLGLEHLSAALFHYNRACTWLPKHHAIYACMASFWRDLGRPDLGRRLLTTVLTILPDSGIQETLLSFPTSAPTFPMPELPEYQPTKPLRILFLCHPESDFGSDVLHDGLRRVLGAENVVGYPWKPVLHGRATEAATGYPCTFDWPEGPVPLERLVQRAAEGGFDVVLYSDTLGTLPRDETHTLLRAAAGTPRFVVDMWDECGDSLEIIRSRDGRDGVAG